jgi:hypothetical protein
MLRPREHYGSVASHGWFVGPPRSRGPNTSQCGICLATPVFPFSYKLPSWVWLEAVGHAAASHHDQAAEYRRQAQEIRTMVQKLSIDEAREQLLETAERLERLAEEEERKAQANNSRPKRQPEA